MSDSSDKVASGTDQLFRDLSSKLPPVLEGLGNAGCGWVETMRVACYLLACVFNRHPELQAEASRLMRTYSTVIPHLEADFAKDQPGLVADSYRTDQAFFLVPETNETGDITVN